jgi:hypothetical protein
MASGRAMCRINGPNIWLHRPAKITKSTLAKTEPSTYGPFLPIRVRQLMGVLLTVSSRTRWLLMTPSCLCAGAPHSCCI